jgi:hypothetical protein
MVRCSQQSPCSARLRRTLGYVIQDMETRFTQRLESDGRSVFGSVVDRDAAAVHTAVLRRGIQNRSHDGILAIPGRNDDV